MTGADVQAFAEIVGLLIGVGTVVTALWKYVIRPVYRWAASIKDVHQKVQRIWQELQPNGGSSIRDQLNRTTEMIARIETRQIISEQIDKQVFAALSLGVFRTDADGRFTEVNRNFCRITGRTQDEVEGTNWTNCIHPEDIVGLYAEWKACVADGRQFERSYRFVRPDGAVQPVHGRACPLLDRDDNSLGYFGTIEKQGEPFFGDGPPSAAH